MALSKKERAAVKKAMGLIESGEEEHTCWALSHAFDGESLFTVLRQKYESFYAANGVLEVPQGSNLKGQRVLMLSLFLAADGELG